MKFGFSVPPVGPGERSDAENYARVIQDCRLGHELGYDAAWALEHHFTPYFPTPDPLLFLSHIAAHCPGLGLGTCVLVLPWYHPLRLTEQIAMLNSLTEGRLYLGLGRGSARYEYDRLGVDMTETRDRFRETVEIIKLGLEGRPFSYEGKYFEFPELIIRPHIRARESIELYGAIGSPASAEIMADLGLSLIHTTNFPDHLTAKFADNWRARAQQNGMNTDGMRFPIHGNPTICAETDDEAMDMARHFYPHFIRVQMEHYETAADYWKDVPGYEIHSKMFANLQKLAQPGPDLDKALTLQMVGSPETIIRRIETMRDNMGIGHVISAHFLYEMDDDLRHRSLRIFAEKVIPHFRGEQAAA